MEVQVTIVSRESIKPSSPLMKMKKAHELCLFDQLFPSVYSVGVVFYPNATTPSKTLIDHLKESLSETLNVYYPFSGRIRDEIFIDDFDTGVPFSEATVDCRMEEYFHLADANDLMDKFVPIPMFGRSEHDPATPIPMLAVKANIFPCGGVAIGVSVYHKLADGMSMFYLFSSWAALSRGAEDEVLTPNFSDAATIFPAAKGLPEKYLGCFERVMLFRKGNFVVKTFSFSTEAVEALREKGASERVPKPTRNEAVTCFIWKHATESSWTSSGYRNPLSLGSQVVNLRGLLKSRNAMGNLFWISPVVVSTNEGAPGSTFELPELVKKMKGATDEFRCMFEGIAVGRSGSEAFLSHLDRTLPEQPGGVISPQQIGFTNLRDFFKDIDFGFGKPIKVGTALSPGTGMDSCNMVVLIDSPSGKGMEATMILEEKLMAVLERDANFLAFASPNPGI